jgi:hypothetical protein
MLRLCYTITYLVLERCFARLAQTVVIALVSSQVPLGHDMRLDQLADFVVESKLLQISSPNDFMAGSTHECSIRSNLCRHFLRDWYAETVSALP